MKLKIIFATAAILLLAGFTLYKQCCPHFSENKSFNKKLQNIVQEVNSMNTHWKAGSNSRWEDIDVKGIKAHMGVLKASSGINLEKKNTIMSNLPKNFDSREKWGKQCPSLLEVRDQSTCGSCWAFAAAESLTDRVCIHTGENVRLSTQNLLTCCASCGDGCNGGWPEAAMQYYVDVGLVSGNLYGDTQYCQAYSFPPCAHHVPSSTLPPCSGELPTPPCKNSCDEGSTISYEQDIHKGAKAYGISANQEAIMTEIYNNGPIEVALTVYEDFLTYKSGVYKHVTGQELGGHAVKMIGWGEENGIPYWLIVNSWNNGWGDNGTFKIFRGNNECGIESSCVAALPLKKKVIQY